jgi:hypothetical protein
MAKSEKPKNDEPKEQPTKTMKEIFWENQKKEAEKAKK